MNTITNKRSMRLLCAVLTVALIFAGWAMMPLARDAQGGARYGAASDYAYAAGYGEKKLWENSYSATSVNSSQWSLSYGQVVATADGGTLTIGTMNTANADYSVMTVRRDADGGSVGSYTYGQRIYSIGYKVDSFSAATPTKDGGVVAAGSTIANYSSKKYNLLIAKFDGQGKMVWWKDLGGGTSDDEFEAVVAVDDGYVAAGYSYLPDSDGDGFSDGQNAILYKVDLNGKLVWNKNITIAGQTPTHINGMARLSDGGIVLSGRSVGDALIAKYDTNGNQLWDKGFVSTQTVFSDDASKLEVTDPTWTGKEISKIEVYSGETKLKQGTDYTVEVISGSTKKIGVVKIRITGIGKYSGSKIVTIKILPKKATKLKLKAGTKSIKATWKKVSKTQKVTGYIVQYKLKTAKKWKSKTVKVSYKGKTTASYTIKKLKKGKTYQVRVVTYKKIASGESKGTYKSLPTAAKSKKVTK